MEMEELFLTYRPLLFSLAYRILGSVMDAEDIVQEAFISLSEAKSETSIRNTKAYLCKIITNRCLDMLRSSTKKRETYIGPWLPEPLISKENEHDPFYAYLRSESISIAYLLLLQQLTAVERAVFLLREIFQYPYVEIASIVGKSTTNCRQIYRRAKQSIHHDPASVTPSSATDTQVKQFVQAIYHGDIDRLMELLSPDVIFYSDGGGKVQAALRPIFGATRVVQLLLGLRKKLPSGYAYQYEFVNGSPGIILTVDGQVINVCSFEFQEGKIESIYVVANPEKLTHLNV